MNNAAAVFIRPARFEDAETIVDFNCNLATETEDKTLDRSVVAAGVRNALQLSDEVCYFVAEADGEVIGQLMLTREWSDWRNGWMAWLQSVYVSPPWRQRGVFRSLLQHAIDHLTARQDVVALRLYVEQDNDTAISTYRRLGFEHPGYHVMEMPLPAENNRTVT